VVERLGRLPETGEELVIEGVRVRILDMGPTAIRWLSLKQEGEVDS
jgi:CBS domain containing-hemolysin-like protein